jgi:hypothetical protein
MNENNEQPGMAGAAQGGATSNDTASGRAVNAAAAGVPQGWKLVPVEPTPEMLDEAGRRLTENPAPRTALEFQADAHTAWDGMLAAAPVPPLPAPAAPTEQLELMPIETNCTVTAGDASDGLFEVTVNMDRKPSANLWTMGARAYLVDRAPAASSPSVPQEMTAANEREVQWFTDAIRSYANQNDERDFNRILAAITELVVGKHASPSVPSVAQSIEDINRIWNAMPAALFLRTYLAAAPRPAAVGAAGLESGWCVERGPASAPNYLHVDGGLLAWTPDHMKAMRFARRADAEQITEIVDDADRIAEHAWHDSPTANGAGGQA